MSPGSDAARLMRLLDYELPEELVAQYPAARREDSRLLVVERATGRLIDSRFAELGTVLRPGDTLVVNETRVRPARLMLQRPTGGRVEMLFVRPAGNAGGEGAWQVLAKPAKHASLGARLATPDGALVVEVAALGEQGERTVRVVMARSRTCCARKARSRCRPTSTARPTLRTPSATRRSTRASRARWPRPRPACISRRHSSRRSRPPASGAWR